MVTLIGVVVVVVFVVFFVDVCFHFFSNDVDNAVVVIKIGVVLLNVV